jgi:uncharacterized protein YutE (UPF0331/DUF86 family)
MKRILQKLNELKDRINFIERNLKNKKEFLENRILKKAIYKEFQEAIEIVFDIISLITKKLGYFNEDDYSNLEKVKDEINLSEKTVKIIKKAKGLRNVLVHEYDEIIDTLAFDSIKRFLPEIKEFYKKIKVWIEKY